MKTNQIISLILLPIALIVYFFTTIFGMGLSNIASFIDFPSLQFVLFGTASVVIIGSDITKFPKIIGGTLLMKFSTSNDKDRAVSFWKLLSWGTVISGALATIISIIFIVAEITTEITIESFGPDTSIAFLSLLHGTVLLLPSIGFLYRAKVSEIEPHNL